MKCSCLRIEQTFYHITIDLMNQTIGKYLVTSTPRNNSHSFKFNAKQQNPKLQQPNFTERAKQHLHIPLKSPNQNPSNHNHYVVIKKKPHVQNTFAPRACTRPTRAVFPWQIPHISNRPPDIQSRGARYLKCSPPRHAVSDMRSCDLHARRAPAFAASSPPSRASSRLASCPRASNFTAAYSRARLVRRLADIRPARQESWCTSLRARHARLLQLSREVPGRARKIDWDFPFRLFARAGNRASGWEGYIL